MPFVENVVEFESWMDNMLKAIERIYPVLTKETKDFIL